METRSHQANERTVSIDGWIGWIGCKANNVLYCTTSSTVHPLVLIHGCHWKDSRASISPSARYNSLTLINECGGIDSWKRSKNYHKLGYLIATDFAYTVQSIPTHLQCSATQYGTCKTSTICKEAYADARSDGKGIESYHVLGMRTFFPTIQPHSVP